MVCAMAALLLAWPTQAACVKKLPNGDFDEPTSYQGLKSCQQAERDALVDSLFGQKVGKEQAAALKSLDAGQRQEEAAYTARHPGRGRLKPAAAPPPATVEKSAPSEDGLQKLKAGLDESSDGGRKGVTPEMAAAIRAHLLKEQGSISPDMEDLLKSTSEDGVNLRTSTMQKLQNGVRQAKDKGLGIGVDPGTEKYLLEEKFEDKPRPDL